jgi:polar amino acid transport system permease protein
VVNYAAYFAEVYRSGIQSIPAGQNEACAVLGLSRWDSFFSIILPQVFKKVLPAMGNEVITLVKDTALAQTIGVAELFRTAQNASSRTFSTLPIFIAGVFYFIMNAAVSKSFDSLEKRLSYYSC